MIATELRMALAAELPALFEVEAEPRPDGSVRLFTPFRYDDGTMAVIFVVRRDGEYVLSDYGETLGWLWVRTGGGELSAKQEYLLDTVCRCELGLPGYRGELTATAPCDRPEELAAAVFRLGLAMVRVADLWFLEPHSAAGMEYNAADGKAAAAGTETEATAKEAVV